ncbi:TPA: hypothetical protein GF618_21630 [Escherichia coli]|nr:hypothetical protein [Escherichia coli]
MNISEQQLNNMVAAVSVALQPLVRVVPMTAVEWADQYYYLPKESSYGDGEWKKLPFQIAIMNSMGNDQIRTVNLIKSARVGYTKMLLGVAGYFIEHKSRNSLLFQPTDSAAEDFMKSHVEATIRDVPCLKDLSPWLGRKHRDNTLTLKRFSSGVGFWCLGGAAAKNYREKSVDVVCYDELSSFEPDVEKEGSPTLLGDKRIEGSVWPKSIRGSTPKIKGSCQIEKAANESAHFMRFYVPCPHCGEAQYLKFGDESTPFGLKWEKDSPESVFYLCEHHGCVIHQSELDQSNGRWICENTGMWTRDGLTFFSAADNEIPPPRSITFHIWTAYSPFTTWVQIVYDWLDALKDPNGLKTFVNTTLGETWEEAVGEKLDHQVLMDKVVHYTAAVNEGWYQIRIAGDDTAPEAVYARLHEQLGEGTVIHIVPRLAGAGKGGLQIVLGAAAIVGSFFTAGGSMALWGTALSAGGFSATTMLFSLGASMILGGVAQMLAPKAKTPEYKSTDNGKQNTYFSSLDNMIAQGNPMPVPYGEMLVGSRRISQDISTRDEGGGGKVVVIGRQG